ncbi:MAG: pitrilysin family protein [Patescibacteria group bacterium]
MNTVKLETVSRGIEVAWHHDPTSPQTYLGILVWAGSLDDPDGKEGLAHYLEHLLFKGTPSSPTTNLLTSRIESVGGTLNAYTSTSATFIFLDVPQKHARRGWETLCDLTCCPLLRSADAERERKIILSEYAERDTQDSLQTVEAIYRQLFGEQLAKKQLILGTETGIRAIDCTDLADFHEHHYRRGPLTFVAVGNLTRLSRHFADFVRKEFPYLGGRVARAPRRTQPRGSSLPLAWHSTELPTKYPQCVITGPLYRQPGQRCTRTAVARERAAAGLVENILWGRGSSSLFAQKMRDDQQLAYSFDMGHSWLDETVGTWGIDFSCLTLDDAAAAAAAIAQIVTTPSYFPDAEISQAKASYLTHWQEKHQSPRDLFHWVGACLADHGYLIQWDEHRQRILSTTPRQVRQVLRKYYHPDRWVTVTFVPTK